LLGGEGGVGGERVSVVVGHDLDRSRRRCFM
jgi:hypothetical protein